MDRQDIDALLIGALYGELTPADEARLAAHLESHPADKTALDDLKSAREQVKASRIFELQTDPPQAISAVLLQEAARRAPRKAVAAVDGEPRESWFHRFVRSFAAHPAMAAAAMLVLVVGIAGTLYMKNGNVGVEKTIGQSDDVAATTPSAPAAEPMAKDQAAAGSAYQVGLAEGQLDRKEQVAQGQDAEKAEASAKAPERAQVAPATTSIAKADTAGAYEPKPAAHSASEGKKSKKGGTGYLEVETPQQMPKEMPDNAEGDKEAEAYNGIGQKQAGPSNKFATAPTNAPAAAPTGTAGNAPGGAGGGAAATGAMQQAAPAPQVAAPPPPPADYAKNTKAPASKSAAPTKASPQPAKTVAKSAPKTEDAPVEATRGDSDLIAWARRQHAAAIAKVKAGDCSAAAALAVTVRGQAYGYYQQNMANDRELKGCASYIANAVNREEERTSKPKAAKSAPDEAPAATQSK